MSYLLYNPISLSLAKTRRQIRILVADDEPLVRSALRLMFGTEPSMYVVAEAADRESLIAKLARHLIHILLLDWELPDLRPIELVQELHKEYPCLKVVALSTRPESHAEALVTGVDVFVSKGDAPDALLAALRSLAVGLNAG